VALWASAQEVAWKERTSRTASASDHASIPKLEFDETRALSHRVKSSRVKRDGGQGEVVVPLLQMSSF